MNGDILLELRNVVTEVPVDGGVVPVVRDVSFAVRRGEVVGLVGESGSGKSMTARSILRLLPPGGRTRGTILFDGADVLEADGARLRALRARRSARIFQAPRCFARVAWTLVDPVVPSTRKVMEARPNCPEVLMLTGNQGFTSRTSPTSWRIWGFCFR